MGKTASSYPRRTHRLWRMGFYRYCGSRNMLTKWVRAAGGVLNKSMQLVLS